MKEDIGIFENESKNYEEQSEFLEHFSHRMTLSNSPGSGKLYAPLDFMWITFRKCKSCGTMLCIGGLNRNGHKYCSHHCAQESKYHVRRHLYQKGAGEVKMPKIPLVTYIVTEFKRHINGYLRKNLEDLDASNVYIDFYLGHFYDKKEQYAPFEIINAQYRKCRHHNCQRVIVVGDPHRIKLYCYIHDRAPQNRKYIDVVVETH